MAGEQTDPAQARLDDLAADIMASRWRSIFRCAGFCDYLAGICGHADDHPEHDHQVAPSRWIHCLGAGSKTDDGAVAPGHELGGSTPAAPTAAAPSSPTGEAVRPGPDHIGGQSGAAVSPRSFQLIRHRDVSGVSGTGPVAEGTQFTDGSAALHWYGEHPSTAVWPSVADILAVHGHQGATVLRWLDGGA